MPGASEESGQGVEWEKPVRLILPFAVLLFVVAMVVLRLLSLPG